MKNNKTNIIETQEMYDQGIEEIDAGEYTKERVIKYGVNVSVARGCPSLWDGLTPVVRRILWFMYHNKSLLPNKRPEKANEFLPATVKYHPHGDQSIIKAFENITKTWENNALYLEMDGNEGSIAGDDAAAPRYLDAKLSQYSYKCFFDEFDESVIEMVPNYLQSDMEPVSLPAKYPNFLVNLTTGIAWGNAFTKVPFNLNESFSLTQALLENPEMTGVYLFPDSPRGYDIIDDGVIKDVCATGIGTVRIRAKMSYHEEGHYILVNGFPEKSTMDGIIRAISLREKQQPLGIKDIADKSNLESTEFWIILKKGVDPEYVMTELYQDSSIKLCGYARILLNYTDRTKMLSETGSISLKGAILKWIDWRIAIKYRLMSKRLLNLRKEKHRLEVLVKLKNQDTIDELFNIIRSTEGTDDEIVSRLIDRFGITSYQANILLDMKVRQQSSQSIKRYIKEYGEIDTKIEELEDTLTSRDKIKEIIWNELEEGKKLFGKPRNCNIIKPMDTETPTFKYRVVVTKQYVKRLPQNGSGAGFLEPNDDVIQYFHSITSKEYINIGTSVGEWCYLPIDKIPATDPSSKGTDLTTLLGITGQVIAAVKTSLPSIKDNPDKYRLYCFTKQGLIKATPLSEYRVTRTVAKAISLNDGDEVCFMGVLSDSDTERLVYTKQGFGIELKLSLSPSTGRLTKGQRVMKIANDDEAVGMCVCRGIREVCIITKKGYGKIIEIDEALTATKKRQDMLELTRLLDGDEVMRVIPIRKEIFDATFIFHLQSGEKKEIPLKDIKLSTRHAKCYKLVPVRKGDSIIRIRIKTD